MSKRGDKRRNIAGKSIYSVGSTAPLVLLFIAILNPVYAKGTEMGETETAGLVKLGEKSLTLVGSPLQIGQKLSDAVVVDQEMGEVNLSSFFGRILIISTVPSLDTPVCSAQTRRFNQEAASLGQDVTILTISNDLPFAQKRFCAAEGIDQVKVLSDYRGQKFGRSVGLFVRETYLLARAVLVVNRGGVVSYVQIVPNLGEEPNYEPVLEAAKELIK